MLPKMAIGVGIALFFKGSSTEEIAFWTLTTIAAQQAILHPIQSTVAVAKGVRYGFTTSLQTMGADLLGWQPTQIVVGAALGYTIGAVTGTAIVHVAEERGLVKAGSTADVLDFYMGKGHYWEQGNMPTPGYFNIIGNAKFIWENARD